MNKGVQGQNRPARSASSSCVCKRPLLAAMEGGGRKGSGPPSARLTTPPASRTRATPCRKIPRRQAQLPIGIEPAGGNISQVERRRAESAHRQRTLRQVGQQGEGVVRVLPQVVREPGDQQALLERRGRRDVDGLAVEGGPPTSDGAEHLVTHRIIDDAELEYAVSLATDRDGEMRQAVGGVGRAA